MIEELHKPEAIAPRVGLSLQAFYAACRAGQFPHVRIGKRIRVPESSLREWIAEQTQKTKAQHQNQSLATRSDAALLNLTTTGRLSQS